MNKIAPAFIKAKRAFGPVLKSNTNPAFKSKYANLEACLEAVDDACLNNGIALYQETSEDSTGVTVETVFLHESGEALRCGKLHVPASKQDPQGYGSALTYARRYSLLAACGIAAEDDDGNAAAGSMAANAPRHEAARQPGDPSKMPPKARAARMVLAIAEGKAADVVESLMDMDRAVMDAIWQHIDAASQNKLLAVWPKEQAA